MFLTNWLLIRGLINLLEWLRGLRKTVYSLDHWFITKDIKGYESTADEVQTKELWVLWRLRSARMRKHSGSPTWKLSELPPFELLWMLHYIGMVD